MKWVKAVRHSPDNFNFLQQTIWNQENIKSSATDKVVPPKKPTKNASQSSETYIRILSKQKHFTVTTGESRKQSHEKQ